MLFAILLLVADVTPQPAAGSNEGLVPLRLGMPSPLGAEQARKDAAELSTLLTSAMKRKVVAEVASPRVLPMLLAQGVVDLGWLSAAQYVEAAAASHGAVVPAAKLMRGGVPYYRSAIFVKSGGAAKKLTDLKGKRLAFVSEQSSAGFTLARHMLQQAGFAEADLKGEKFFGDHAAVCRAVLNGEADAGATFANDGRGGSLAGCEETVGPEESKGLRVLATSDPIPNDVVALRPEAPPDMVAAVRSALLGMAKTPEGKQKLQTLFHADAFVPAEDADYATLREQRAK
ncbi:MAG TPA: PhnD/SsuA/transferrin family substrate-binding protein [Myxococcales bacterium]